MYYDYSILVTDDRHMIIYVLVTDDLTCSMFTYCSRAIVT